MGGELECSGRRTQVHPVETVLDRTLENRRSQLVLREVRVEKQPVVPHLVPLASLPALAHTLVEAGAGGRGRNRIADVIEGEAAREVDALDERVGGLAQVADHEEAGGLDPGRDARLDGSARLVRRDAFLHLLQDVLVAGLDAEEDPLAAGAAHLLEERSVDVRDAAQAFPRKWEVGGLDRLRELEGALVVESEQVVRHPYVVVTERRDFSHLCDDGLHGPRAEQVSENRLVAEIAAKGTSARRHQRGRRILPVFAPVGDVLGVWHVAPIGQWKMRHVLGPDLGCASHDLAVTLEDDTGYLFEATVVEVLHDLDDRLLALADGDEVEIVDERFGLTGRVWATDGGQRLAPNLGGKRELLGLHRDHA